MILTVFTDFLDSEFLAALALIKVSDLKIESPQLCSTYDVQTRRGGVGTPKADESTDKLHECDSDKEGWGPKTQKNGGRLRYMSPPVSLSLVRRRRHPSPELFLRARMWDRMG